MMLLTAILADRRQVCALSAKNWTELAATTGAVVARF
jgi:hypothetical protein